MKNSMTFENLTNLIKINLPNSLNLNKGLNYFAAHRAKFEGWLKVELCNIFSNHFDSIIPEKDFIDIVVDDWAIELKTLSTNYKYDRVINKSRPITDNINSVLKDIKALRHNILYQNKCVIFVVFPLTLENKSWEKHIQKIDQQLHELETIPFRFENGVNGIIYIGLV